MPDIAPCLWFNGQAEDAARFYTGIFPNSAIGTIGRWGDNGRAPAGSVLLVEFTLDGKRFQALNGGPEFTQTPAVSFSVPCEDQAEVDHYWTALTADGGKPGQCGWLADQFGVSWQIAPRSVERMLRDGSSDQRTRMFRALMQMDKLNIAALEAAFAGT